MASTRATFTFDAELARSARRLGINVSAAAREGLTAAIERAMADADRAAYAAQPEQPDEFWDEAEAWSDA